MSRVANVNSVNRFRHIGIQQRIMLYVTIGLAAMFGGFAFIGLRSIQQATELVYQERLTTAYTTAGIFERDFLHVVRDVQELSPGSQRRDAQRMDYATAQLLHHLSTTDPFPFFQVSGIWVMDAQGRVIAEVGMPKSGPGDDTASIASFVAKLPKDQFIVLPALNGSYGGIPFVAIATQLSDTGESSGLSVIVHIVSVNSSAPYVPFFSYYGSGTGKPVLSSRAGSPQTRYHLEVVRPDGVTVLGIGEDEQPGEMSRHFPVIQRLMAKREATTLLHRPRSGETFKPHVMAVVPLASSNLYLILEQPVDVALELPMELQQRVIALTVMGFLATLLVAWITTRHVVKPTEQLTAAAQRMAEGDLESPINVTAQDEVDKLAESLDTMRQKLNAAYQQVANANEELELQVKERTARLGEVLRKVISAQEEERYRLARELHDETAQTLGALSIALDRTRDELRDASPENIERISEAKSIASRLLEETRRLILDLRPMVLDDLGLGPAIRWYAETHLEEQGVNVTLEVEQLNARLPKHIEVSLFRIVQEAMNNIAKHANARQAYIRLSLRDSVVGAVIKDDGKGFDVSQVMGPKASTESVGLLGMQERVRLLNGRVQIHSGEGKGTEVLVEIPIGEGAS